MKHKHYDMIVAKAANMELVVFVKDGNYWNELVHATPFHEVNGYFLCLPQHKEACLHWLNGGDVERLTAHQGFLKVGYGLAWSACHEFMNEELEFRVKPKKEKRWIGVFRDGSRFKNTEFSYETVDELKAECWAPFGFDNWQFIEIEVEV